jgi:ABC-2 type transport system ATP-binding protein
MRVHEYLDFFGAAYAIPRRQREQRISEVLDITASEYMRDRYVSALSHGMQQRIGIARTLLHDPEVLILDEPANGLDPKARVEMRELILHLAQLGKTVIVTSHILPELSRICDQVAIMNQGRLVAHGTLKDIMKTFTQLRWLEIQTADASTLAQTKEIIKPFASDEANISISEPESSLRFGTLTLEEGWGNMLNALVTAGIKVTQFREIQTDLEDAFLSVTREPGSENSKFAPRNKA